MEKQTKPRWSRKKHFVYGVMFALFAIYIILDNYFVSNSSRNEISTIIGAFFFGSLALWGFLNALPENRFKRMLEYVLIIPLAPLLASLIAVVAVGALLTPFVLPAISLGLIYLLVTFVFDHLIWLQLGVKFNTQVIPFLNLTTTAIVFTFFGRTLARYVADLIPENVIPQGAKDVGLRMLEKEYFVKLLYLVFVFLLVVSIILKSLDITLLETSVGDNSVLFQSLVVYLAIDQFLVRGKDNV